MKLTEFSVKNYQFTLMIFLAVLSLGLYSLFTMPRSEDPEFTAPSFFIAVVYPGTNPEDMEQLIVNPIEARFNELENIKRIYSEVADGIATVRVEYKFNSDPDTKYQEVIREINALQKELPTDIAAIRIEKFSPTDVSIYQWALISENASYTNLQHYADKFGDALERVRSLKNIKKWGFPKQKVNIELSLDKMAQVAIPLGRVLGAIQSEALNIPGGSIATAGRKFNVKTSGEYQSVDEIANTIVSATGTKVVYLKDIATVQMGYQNETHITRLNGHRCVFVTVSQKDKENIIAVQNKVLPVVEQFRKELPKNIDLVKVFDQPKSVDSRLNRFGKDFSIAILLVLITLIPLGWRASVVVMISIPLSLAIGLAMLNFTGYNINQLSIVGMIVALGILVDDSIVVVENIERFLREGYSRRDAAIKATNQISVAVLGCTILLIFAFLPLCFLPEASGAFIRSLPLSVSFTVLASLLVALTVVPFLSSVILSKNHKPDGNAVMKLLKKLISGSYGRALDWALKHPKTMLLVAVGIFASSLALIPVVGFSLFPKSEKPIFMVNIQTPIGTKLQATNQVVARVEHILKNTKDVRLFASNTGRGNPRVYYNEIPRNEAENYGQIFVQTTGFSTAEKSQLIDALRLKLKDIPGADIEVKHLEQGPPVEAPIAYRIFGENLDTLRLVAEKVEKILAENPGTIYVKNPLKERPTDLRVAINHEKAGMLGVATAEIDRAVRLGVAGLNVSKFRNQDGDEIPIVATIPYTGKIPTMEVFDKLYVNNVQGTAIPLRQLTSIGFETSPNGIRHFDKSRYVTLSAFVRTGYNTQEVNNELTKSLAAFKFPVGFSYEVAGEKGSQKESFGGIGVIIIIALFGFIGVLILEFGNFKSTLIVLSVIPLGIIGAILMLFFWGQTLSFVATVGFIALVGIEVKNSLLLVDFTNQLRQQGMGLEEAIRQAGEIRFVPIVLTSLTAIGGLMPLVWEFSDLYSPLALVLIGGIISSTLLSRLVTPVMYKLLPPAVEAQK